MEVFKIKHKYKIGISIILAVGVVSLITKLSTEKLELEKEVKTLNGEIIIKENEIEKGDFNKKGILSENEFLKNEILEKEILIEKRNSKIENLENQVSRSTTNTRVKTSSNMEKGNFQATAYCNCSICCGQWAGMNTASGTYPQEGRTIAVDPNVIPLGSRVKVEGYGTFIAEDTGSAIKGNIIDMYFENHNDAMSFGRKRNLKVTVLK